MIAVGSRVRILAPHSGYHLSTAIVTQITPTGNLQVRSEVDGQFDIFRPSDVAEVKAR